MPDDLDVAFLAVSAAAAVALRAFGDLASVQPQVKDDGSVVTEADRQGEQAARDVLARHRPGDAVLGEEFALGDGADRTGRRWIVDPIDGTAHFVRGDDPWLVLLALEVDEVLEVAVAAVPAQGRVWWAVRGGGASAGTLDAAGTVTGARPLAVSPPAASPGFPRIGVVPAAPFQLDTDRDLARRAGAGAEAAQWPLHPALLVAQGDLDVAVQTRASIWDVAATTLIVAEAGGLSSGVDGSPGLGDGPRVFSAGPAVHAVVLAATADGPP
ncbi:inositol monophosphatase family protein [Kineococcus sp. DHX-1]|uniref:inositol monophosphatase family protein n=1 Tax=Kineococcus sp. DHX-1 TaxID=3349638 RepID=UPI0036D20B1C